MRSRDLWSLRTRAATLDAAVLDEQRRPQPDSLRICALKRRKLAVRDEIARLGAQAMRDHIARLETCQLLSG